MATRGFRVWAQWLHHTGDARCRGNRTCDCDWLGGLQGVSSTGTIVLRPGHQQESRMYLSSSIYPVEAFTDFSLSQMEPFVKIFVFVR